MAQTRAQRKPRQHTYALGAEKPKTFIVNIGDVVILSRGQYSDYGIIGVLIRGPNSRPLGDLMAAFRTAWRMQPEEDRQMGWAYSGDFSHEGLIRMCVAGGWYAPPVHEFYLEDNGHPEGDYTEFSATTYGDGTHPNTPETEAR